MKQQSNIIDDKLSKTDRRWLNKPGHHLIRIDDEDYPSLLAETVDAPRRLFARGQRELLSEPKFSIVGSRRPTPIGQKVARTFSNSLSQLGLVITSGMALGIDGIAHQAALDGQNPTIAVMGCGLDTLYPAKHKKLFEQITTEGLMLSEYPLGTPPRKAHFPQRNRIISGLSYGVLIIEAAERSGTLITARLAVEQNREVFVIPGSVVNPQYRGSHRLIQQGAVLVQTVEDILQEVTIPLNQKANAEPSLNTKQYDHPLLSLVDYESTSIEKIISTSGLTAEKVSSMLLVLEIDGLITMANDGGYVKLI